LFLGRIAIIVGDGALVLMADVPSELLTAKERNKNLEPEKV
jgi:hypothetical protein